jgi:serine/threonine-protein kinase
VVETTAGARFGRYEILRRIGVGGAAEVFEARHIELHKRVALKVAHPMPAADDRSIKRCLREGRAATAIHHPNVVDVIDVGVEGRTPYLVMELLEGESLADFLKRKGPLRIDEAAELLLSVISGICVVHRAGIIHRDLKPSNILLARRYRGVQPVVVDFGISISQTEPPTSSQGVVGTVPYMSPEQIRGLPEATPEWDQYALGVILYECVTGGPPFWSDDRYELLHSIVTGSVIAPSQVNPGVPSAFDAIVLRALARDPKDRFPTVQALGKALWPFAGVEGRATWSAEFGLTAATQERERDEASATLVAYSRGARRGRVPLAAVRRARLAMTAVGAVALLGMITLGGRVVMGKASSNGSVVASPRAEERLVAPAPTGVTNDIKREPGLPERQERWSSAVLAETVGEDPAPSPPVALPTVLPPRPLRARATSPTAPSAETRLPRLGPVEVTAARPEPIDPLDIR